MTTAAKFAEAFGEAPPVTPVRGGASPGTEAMRGTIHIGEVHDETPEVLGKVP